MPYPQIWDDAARLDRSSTQLAELAAIIYASKLGVTDLTAQLAATKTQVDADYAALTGTSGGGGGDGDGDGDGDGGGGVLTYYVSPTGSNANDGLTPTTAKQTIAGVPATATSVRLEAASVLD